MVEIRTARAKDEAALVALEAATWSPSASPGPRPEPGRRVLERVGLENALVAIDGAEIVGSLLVGPWLPLPSADHVVLIKGLAVDPARQGDGIGTALLDAAIERVRSAGKRRLVLRVLSTNPGARRLYVSRGFEVEGTSREAFLIDGAYVDDVTMALDLTRAVKPPTCTETVVGIDVGGHTKGFHACALRGTEIVAGPTNLADVRAAVKWIASHDPALVAIDSPRSGAPRGQRSRPDERELNKAVCGIRWTPPRAELAGNPYYEWIVHGLKLYAALGRKGIGPDRAIEVFPTAAWTRWVGLRAGRPRGRWSAAALRRLGLTGVPERALSQDDRDAIAAALVARLHLEGRTDAYGEIIVPAAGTP